jgi:hypothetical protein
MALQNNHLRNKTRIASKGSMIEVKDAWQMPRALA